MYVKDRLFQINNYITFKPRVKTPVGFGTIIIDQNCYRIQYDNGKFENLVKSIRFWGNEFKLLLRNLSDLTKKIEHNGEKFVPKYKLPIEIDENLDFETYSCAEGGYNEIDSFEIYECYQKLFEWHFDVFGLIEKGEAIDINI